MFDWLQKISRRNTRIDTSDYVVPEMTPEFQNDSRVAAQRLNAVMAEIRAEVQPGATGIHIDNKLGELIFKAGLKSTMKGYRGYPYDVAVSVNHQVLHAGPSDRKFEAGDLVTVQSNVAFRSGNANLGWTFGVGSPNSDQVSLLQIGDRTFQKLESGIDSGMHVGDIGHIIQSTSESEGLSVVREYCGFGMRPGVVHSEPQVLCYGQPGTGPRLARGDVLNIHVIATAGKSSVRVLADGWTVVTRDHSHSALFVAMYLVGDHRLERMAGPPT